MQIEVHQLSKRFGSLYANRDINLTFPGGKIIGILGENGAGKSTLMKILAGYQPPFSGEIHLDGRRVNYRTVGEALTLGIGMLQQDPLDVPAFTALENFLYGGKPMSRRAARQQFLSYTQRFGFEINPDARDLSIAQRQQLEIIRLLALGVRCLILDEPTTGISTEQKQTLFEALRRLAHEEGMTILLVSHKLEDVIALCDSVAVLRSGRVVGTRDMPATADDLVRMMFERYTPPRRPAASIVKFSQPVLSLRNATLANERITIGRLNFELYPGEIIGLAGLEGSGQELLLRAAAGLTRLEQGEVVVNGKPMTPRHYRDYLENGVAFAPAGRLEEGLLAGLTLTEHRALAASRRSANGLRLRWQEARQQTEQAINQYQVRGKPESRVETLSGGNQQRLLLSLLPADARVLILEQPTRGLDVDSARWIWQQLLARREQGAAILFSSAELEEILMYSDRVLAFFAGQVTEFRDIERLSSDELGYAIGGKAVDGRQLSQDKEMQVVQP
jgi:general nucleoside transport system ATP-binding protein